MFVTLWKSVSLCVSFWRIFVIFFNQCKNLFFLFSGLRGWRSPLPSHVNLVPPLMYTPTLASSWKRYGFLNSTCSLFHLLANKKWSVYWDVGIIKKIKNPLFRKAKLGVSSHYGNNVQWIEILMLPLQFQKYSKTIWKFFSFSCTVAKVTVTDYNKESIMDVNVLGNPLNIAFTLTNCMVCKRYKILSV